MDRFQLACKGPGAIPCADAQCSVAQNGRAFVYGQATAISGDLLSSPEEFFSAIGGEHVLNTTYGRNAPGFIAIPFIRESFYPRVRELSQFRQRIEAATTDDERAKLAVTMKPERGRPESADELYLSPMTSVHNRAFKDWGANAWWLFGGRNFKEAGTWQGIVPKVDPNLKHSSKTGVRYHGSGPLKSNQSRRSGSPSKSEASDFSSMDEAMLVSAGLWSTDPASRRR